MSPTLVGIIGLVVMLAIFMTRMPVAYVMTLVGWIGFSIDDLHQRGVESPLQEYL